MGTRSGQGPLCLDRDVPRGREGCSIKGQGDTAAPQAAGMPTSMGGVPGLWGSQLRGLQAWEQTQPTRSCVQR